MPPLPRQRRQSQFRCFIAFPVTDLGRMTLPSSYFDAGSHKWQCQSRLSSYGRMTLIGRRDGVAACCRFRRERTASLALQPGHYAKVPFSPTRGSPCTSPRHPAPTRLFGDLKNPKTAASKSLKGKAPGEEESRPFGPFPNGNLDHQVAGRSQRIEERWPTAQALFDPGLCGRSRSWVRSGSDVRPPTGPGNSRSHHHV
jgi:hypothetical protein